jgi:hypothetical protein
MKPEVPGKTNSLAEETFEEASRPLARRSVLKGALVSAPLLLVGPSLFRPDTARAAGNIGPSTTTEPYLVPSIAGVKTISILTVGDSVGGYRMVGIPDGLGAFRDRRGSDPELVEGGQLLALFVDPRLGGDEDDDDHHHGHGHHDEHR